MTRRFRAEPEHLVDGLTFDERLSRLELRLLGDAKVPGLEREHSGVAERVEQLEHLQRQASLPFWTRWLLRWTR